MLIKKKLIKYLWYILIIKIIFIIITKGNFGIINFYMAFATRRIVL